MKRRTPGEPVTRSLWTVLLRQVPPSRRRDAMALAMLLDKCIRIEARQEPAAEARPNVLH